jgi:hypothetical protein
MVKALSWACKTPYFRPFARRPAPPGATAPGAGPLVRSAAPRNARTRRPALSSPDPNYDPATDVYKQIYQGHDNASAVTNSEGLTVYFDPDTNDVLGFSIAAFSEYYKAHATPDGEFEVSLPAKVPPSIEEEMDFDAETIRSGVRIAEFY